MTVLKQLATAYQKVIDQIEQWHQELTVLG